MSRIVIDSRELKTSSGRYVEKLLYYLQKLDGKNTYALLVKPKDTENRQPSRSNFQVISCPYKEFSLGEQLGLKRQIKGLGADLVHFTFPQQPILYRGKTITTIHDLTTLRYNNPSKNIVVFKFKQKIFKWVMERAIHKSAEVIVPSGFVKEDILATFKGVRPEKISVTYEAAEAIKDRAEAVLELEDKPFIMYVGRPMPHKNLINLIEAFNKLQARYPELILVLGGKKDANYASLEELTNSRGYKNIMFTGFLSEGQLKWLYEHTKAYVFPSLSEGFGLPGLEAMVHGAPVISSSASCLPEIYGDAACYFEPENIDSIEQAIRKVLDDNQLQKRLVSAGKERVKRYSWEKMAEQTLAIYKEVLGS